MNDIITLADIYRKDIGLRAVAHEISSEWHRGMGALLGGVATMLSALISTSVFVTLTTQAREGKLDIHGWKYWLILIAGGLLLALSPVLTGIQTYLKHPEQAAAHKFSYVRYTRVKQRLDLFILKYEDAACLPENRAQAMEELNAISIDIEKIALDDITLTQRAYENAKNVLSGKTAESWWKTLPWFTAKNT